jgi:hypothetical protein
MLVSWILTRCGLVGRYQSFKDGGSSSITLTSTYKSTWCYDPEDHITENLTTMTTSNHYLKLAVTSPVMTMYCTGVTTLLQNTEFKTTISGIERKRHENKHTTKM